MEKNIITPGYKNRIMDCTRWAETNYNKFKTMNKAQLIKYNSFHDARFGCIFNHNDTQLLKYTLKYAKRIEQLIFEEFFIAVLKDNTKLEFLKIIMKYRKIDMWKELRLSLQREEAVYTPLQWVLAVFDYDYVKLLLQYAPSDQYIVKPGKVTSRELLEDAEIHGSIRFDEEYDQRDEILEIIEQAEKRILKGTKSIQRKVKEYIYKPGMGIPSRLEYDLQVSSKQKQESKCLDIYTLEELKIVCHALVPKLDHTLLTKIFLKYGERHNITICDVYVVSKDTYNKGDNEEPYSEYKKEVYRYIRECKNVNDNYYKRLINRMAPDELCELFEKIIKYIKLKL